MTNNKHHEFFYHTTIPYKPFLWIMVFSTLIGIPVFHLLLSQWHDAVAWIVTILSVFLVLWLMYDYRLIKNNPIILTSSQIQMYIGSRWHVDVPLENIKTIETHMSEEKIEAYLNLSILNETNVYLALKQPITIRGVFGKKKVSDKLALYVDDSSEFIVQLKEYMNGV